MENNNRAEKAYRSLFTFGPYVEATYAEKNRTMDDSKGKLYLDGMYDGMLLYANAFKTTYRGFNSRIRGTDIVGNMLGTTFTGINW